MHCGWQTRTLCLRGLSPSSPCAVLLWDQSGQITHLSKQPFRWHSITRGHSARGRSRGTGLQAADNYPLRGTTNTHQLSGFTVVFCKAAIGHLQLPGVLLKFWPNRHALRKQFIHRCHICISCLNRAVLISLLHQRSFLSKHNCDKAISTLAAMQNRREKGETGKYGGVFHFRVVIKHWS